MKSTKTVQEAYVFLGLTLAFLFARYKGLLKPNGLYLAGAGGVNAFVQMAWTAVAVGKKVIAGMAPDRAEDLVFLKGLLEAGKVKPVIDRRYPPLYDKFLLAVSLGLNGITIWYAWKWS